MKKNPVQRGFELRILAMKKGLTGRAIAKALRCHYDLVSKVFSGKRIAAMKRIEKYVRSYKPKKRS